MIQWQDWEQFVAEFEAFFNNVLIELGRSAITSREFTGHGDLFYVL